MKTKQGNPHFSFGCASERYRAKEHPRLLCDAGSLAHLKKKLSTGPGLKLMDALRAKVAPYAGYVHDSPDVVMLVAHHMVRNHPGGGLVINCLADMAFVGVIDNDERMITAVIKVLDAIPAAEEKGPRDSSRLGYDGGYGAVTLAFDLMHEFMSKAQRAAFCRWAVKSCVRESLAYVGQKRYIRAASVNEKTVGMVTGLIALLAVEGEPGVPDLKKEKAELLRYFEATLFTFVGDNGYPPEDIGYGTAQVGIIARVAESLMRAGVLNPYTLNPVYEKFGQAVLHFMQPWGEFSSNTGDYAAEVGYTSLVLPRMASHTNDPALLWMQSTLTYPSGSSGPVDIKKVRKNWPEVFITPELKVPVDIYSALVIDDLVKPLSPEITQPETQFVDTSRGLVTFRSGWDKDATFIVFDAATRPTSAFGHEHDSGTHFSLSALGEYFAIDTGRYCMEQDQHNVVLVNGKSGRSLNREWVHSCYQGLLTGYSPAAFVDTACADNSQMANCYLSRRTIGLVKDMTGQGVPNYVWTVEDVNKDNKLVDLWWTMNVNPNHKIQLSKDRATVIGSDHGNCLDISFATTLPENLPAPIQLSLEQDIQMSSASDYLGNKMLEMAKKYEDMTGNLAYGPVFARPRVLAKFTGTNGKLMSVMIPREKGKKPAKVKRLQSPDHSLAVQIDFEDVTDTLIWAYDHHILEAGDISARGNWCLVRRSRKTGAVIAHQLQSGMYLKVAGKMVVDNRSDAKKPAVIKKKPK